MKKIFITLLTLLSVLSSACSVAGGDAEKYTKEILDEKLGGAVLSERDFKFGKVESIEYTLKDTHDENYRYSFYLFDREADAKKALEFVKENWIDEDCAGVETENTVNGVEKGVMDATLVIFAYQTGNLIITTHDTSVGYDPEFEDAREKFYDDLYNNTDEFYARLKEEHEELMQNW